MNIARAGLIFLLMSAFQAPALAAGSGYQVSIPGSFSADGDGRWTSGASSIKIWTTVGKTVDGQIQSDIAASRSKGMTLGNNGQLVEVSGSFALFFAAKDGKGFYEKAIAGCHGTVVMRVDYPASSADSLPGYLDGLASSLRKSC